MIITTLCDGISALEAVGRPITNIKVKQKHSDIISLTTTVWNSTSDSITKEHVKAHQDDLQKQLTIKETINCKMDRLVKDMAIKDMQTSHRLFFTHITRVWNC